MVGGLSANFHDPASSVTSWLQSGLRMVQGNGVHYVIWSKNSQYNPVTIGITVGLFTSNLLVAIYQNLRAKLHGQNPKRLQNTSAF